MSPSPLALVLFADSFLTGQSEPLFAATHEWRSALPWSDVGEDRRMVEIFFTLSSSRSFIFPGNFRRGDRSGPPARASVPFAQLLRLPASGICNTATFPSKIPIFLCTTLVKLWRSTA